MGDDVRYDGRNKLSAAVMALSPYVEWISVCPEVEVGMGVPREPIQLNARSDGVLSAEERVRVAGVQSGEDWTERMEQWTSQRVAELASLGISGFVLKARSPSCGPANVAVHHREREPTPTGRGLFAEALTRTIPDLPMEDEEALENPRVRELFLERIREYARRHASR